MTDSVTRTIQLGSNEPNPMWLATKRCVAQPVRALARIPTMLDVAGADHFLNAGQCLALERDVLSTDPKSARRRAIE